MSPGAQVFPLSAVVGQERLRLALDLLAVDPLIGGLLIRGEKGTAKTTAVRGLAAVLPSSAGTRPPFVELPLGATEDRVVGSLDLDAVVADGRARLRPGLLAEADGGILYVDEVNLLADHLVDVVLDAAATGSVTVQRDGLSSVGRSRFALVGTMNPEEGELRPQLLDRFGLSAEVAAPREAELRVRIVRARREFDRDPAGFLARAAGDEERLRERLARSRAALDGVELPDRELERIALVCIAADVDGMRADVVLARAASAHAALEGRAVVAESDVRAVAALVLAHRQRRDPFDPVDSSGQDVERALDEAAEQLGDEPDDPHDPDGGPDDDPHDPDGGPDDDPHDPDGGQDDDPDGPGAGPGEGGPGGGPAADSSDEGEDGPSPAPGGVVPDARRAAGSPPVLRLPGRGRGAAGRRSDAAGEVGRLVSAAGTERSRIHWPDTLRAATVRRAQAPGAALLAGDLRPGARRGREGNLVVFLVDASGSMAARRRLDVVAGSCVALLRDAYVRRDRVAVVLARGAGAEVVVPPTRSVDVAVQRLVAAPTGGRTPLAEGLAEAAALVRREQLREPDRRAVLVALTDGRATAGPDARHRALAAAAAFRQAVPAGTLVVDCEAGRVRLGGAAELAEALGAPSISLDELGSGTVPLLLRAA